MPSIDQVADILTKHLSTTLFFAMRSKLCVTSVLASLYPNVNMNHSFAIQLWISFSVSLFMSSSLPHHPQVKLVLIVAQGAIVPGARI